MKVVVFSADDLNGAMTQFASTIARTCLELGHETLIYFPNTYMSSVDSDLKSIERRYIKSKSINPFNGQAKIAARKIEQELPDVLLFPADAIFSMQVLFNLKRDIKKAFVIHDVNPHPTNAGARKKITYWFSLLMRTVGLKYADRVLLPSKNSLSLFCSRYKTCQAKALIYPLGAHIPRVGDCKKPPEISDSSDFILYFGRIDKYKGVSRLIKAYRSAIDENRIDIPLVIAGRGELGDDNHEIISQVKSVNLINRFIADEEMIWLFQNCRFVVLPYIEASQSGVLPMAYAFSKPVIASNIQGLSENVEPEKTGILVNDDEELKQAIVKFSIEDLGDYCKKCRAYSDYYLD